MMDVLLSRDAMSSQHGPFRRRLNGGRTRERQLLYRGALGGPMARRSRTSPGLIRTSQPEDMRSAPLSDALKPRFPLPHAALTWLVTGAAVATARRGMDRQPKLSTTIYRRQATVDAVVSEPQWTPRITAVDTDVAPDASPLDRLATVRRLADSRCARHSTSVLEYHVDAAREADSSWTEIGCTLGVTKQAAQQRYVALTRPAAGNCRPAERAGCWCSSPPRRRRAARPPLPAPRAPRPRPARTAGLSSPAARSPSWASP